MAASANPASGLIFVLVGPGGAGKNAIMQAVTAGCARMRQLATATTRPMRNNEMQGREHQFVSLARFQRMIADGELLEHQEVTPGKWYGIPRSTVSECLRLRQIRIADIEPLGAQKLAEAFPRHTVRIFITVPGATLDEQLAILKQRMCGRDDGATDIEERLKRAQTLELPYQRCCDHVVVNDDLARAIDRVRQIIKLELETRALSGAAS